MYEITRRLTRSLVVWGWIVALSLLVACDAGGTNELDDEEPAPEAGMIEVTVTTSGNSTDEDGYTVTLDDASSKSIDVDGTVTFEDLDEGTYSVELGDLDAGCTVEGDNPRSAEVAAGETTTVAFDVTCEVLDVEGTIAFVRTVDQNPEIHTMKADGTDLQRLTDNTLIDEAPALSPDGTQIAFVRMESTTASRSIWVMDIDGSGETQLTSDDTNDRAPAWSPDGDQMVFESAEDDGFNLYVMNADGSELTQITDDAAHDLQPAWSPNGERIAFVRSQPDGSDSDLYTIRPDGTDLDLLIEASSENGEVPASPSWAPDGSRIAYRGSAPAGVQRLFVADADGSNAQIVTPDSVSIEQPDWAPDSDHIAFQARYNIWITRADGSLTVPITNDDDLEDTYPNWGITAD